LALEVKEALEEAGVKSETENMLQNFPRLNS